MGWGSAGNIFDPIAKHVIQWFAEGKIRRDEAIEVLAILARMLFEGDWDTEDESLEACNNHWLVYEAFKKAGWEPPDDE